MSFGPGLGLQFEGWAFASLAPGPAGLIIRFSPAYPSLLMNTTDYNRASLSTGLG